MQQEERNIKRGHLASAFFVFVLAGVFIHEAFGHLSESDTLYRNEELKKIMTKGKRVASPVLNVFDDGN
ncbi:MAG TPA: hypothetical protein PKN88_07525, partial [Bacillota bacterium]|nr:hypothetical protein [Bacillota bacterium]